MKAILFPFLLLVLSFFFGPSAHAQNFVFSSFQCNPSACQDTGPTLETSVAILMVDATCTGGAVEPFSVQVTASVANCQVPYTPFVLAEQLHTTLLDDCGNPYQVDTARYSAEVFNTLGQVVFSSQKEESCDGGTGQPTAIGTKPC